MSIDIFGMRRASEPSVPQARKPRILKEDFFKYFPTAKLGCDIRGIVWHHSATKDGQTFNTPAIRRYHVETKGWNDIGYHGLVEYATIGKSYMPTIVPGRPLTSRGAHTYFLVNGKPIREYNDRYIGLCMIGNFDLIKPPEEIWDLSLRLTRTFQDFYRIPNDRILGHRECCAAHGIEPLKTCPGTMFDMSRFRQNL